MKVQAPFGFVTGCHAGDRFMVQATLSSMRHYCPDIPICLTVDGDFDVSDLKKQYDLIVLRVSELPSEPMRKMMCGNYRAKLAASWEGPFECPHDGLAVALRHHEDHVGLLRQAWRQRP